MKNKLYILCGIPFSGKTTLAKKLVERLGFTRIDLDEVKFDLFGSKINDSEINQEGWDGIYQEMYKQIRESLLNGETVVQDTGNFTKDERLLVKKIADESGVETLTIFVDTQKVEAYQRLIENRKTKRRFDVSDSNFESTVAEMERPENGEENIVFEGKEDIDSWIKRNITD